MSTDERDRNLIKKCLDGNRAAFKTLVDKYKISIFNLALRMTGDRCTSEKITREVFIFIHINLCRYNPKLVFSRWLYVVALDEINKCRKISKKVNIKDLSFEKVKSRKLIQDALLELSDEYRTIIILKHCRELTYDYLAYLLEVSEDDVVTMLKDARNKLKKILVKRFIKQ